MVAKLAFLKLLPEIKYLIGPFFGLFESLRKYYLLRLVSIKSEQNLQQL